MPQMVLAGAARRHSCRCQIVDAEQILGIGPGAYWPEAGASCHVAEAIDGVLVGVLGMDGFAVGEREGVLAHRDELIAGTDDPALLRHIDGLVTEG